MILSGGSTPRIRPVGRGLCYLCTLPSRPVARWAWVADTHIGENAAVARQGWPPAQRLERVVEEIKAVRPDGVVVNGDLAWSEGTCGDYGRFRQIVGPLIECAPLVLGVGNHDNRRNLLAVLSGLRDTKAEWLAAVVEQPPFRFVQLDSQGAPGEVGGEIGSEQLHWLERVLESEERLRTILFVHHPGESSSEGCRDFDALLDLTKGFPAIRTIVTGHDHAFRIRRIGSVDQIALPAVGFPFDAKSDCGWVEAALTASGLEVAFHGSLVKDSQLLTWRGDLEGLLTSTN